MARFSFFRKLTAPGSLLGEAFLENSDGCAGSRRCILGSTVTTGLITTMTAGVYFTGLLLAMGASESYIGYTTAITSFSGLFQLLTPLLLERFPRRKSILLMAKIVYHFLNIIVIGVLPILPIATPLKLVLFMVTLIALNAINHIATPGISAWQMQSLPLEKRGHFYTVSNTGVAVLNKISAFLAGILLDRFEADGTSAFGISPTLTAILLIRAGALVCAVLECCFYAKTKEFPYETASDNTPAGGLRLLALPLADKRFMKTISLPVFWGFVVGIVGAYFNIYLLEEVHMSYSLISLGGFISMPVALLSTPLWYKAMRKFTWPKLLTVTLLGNAFSYFCNPFITSSTLFIYFFCIVCGTFFDVCLNVINSNLVYLHMPKANRTAYFSLFSILKLLGTFLGNYTGILFIQLTGSFRFTLFGFSLGNKQYISLLSSALFVALAIWTFSFSRNKEYNTRIV
ncbi:MAG: MFS transporter [Oscillospiraceae bacterium]|nr:MFS transporter [Oscillospiraceae bacterium]